ncbi:MAG: hypothetical protein J1F02_01145 [Lachnospiraceae bacterium]|nr:hypothetical protein [Lachnospiraceae bacterium]
MTLTKEDLQAIAEMMDKLLEEKLEEKLEPIRTDIAELKKDVAILKKDVAMLKKRMTFLEKEVATLKKNYERLAHEVKVIQLTLETEVLPRLSTIEAGYVSTSRRYTDSTEHYDQLQTDMDVAKEILREHSIQLQDLQEWRRSCS